MSLPRLWARLARLEAQVSALVWYADVQTLVDGVVATAGAVVGLPPPVVHGVRTALHASLQELGRRVPQYWTNEHRTTEVVDHALTALLAALDTHIADAHTRQQLRTEIAQAFHDHAFRDRLAAEQRAAPAAHRRHHP